MRHRVPTAVRLTLIAAAIATLSLGASARAFATDQPVDDTGGGDDCSVTVDPVTTEPGTSGEEPPAQVSETDCPSDDGGIPTDCAPSSGSGSADDESSTGAAGTDAPALDKEASVDDHCPMADGAAGGGACAADPSSCLDASADSATPRANESATVTAESAGTLPLTGSADGPLALAGAMCIAGGAALLASQRRSDSLAR